MNNYRLTLSYDGTKYKGWQRLSHTDNTIQQKVESVLSRLLEQDVEVASSGRTDAGVHARKQVCSFHADTALSCDEILEEIRRYLPQDIGAQALEPAPPRFHARLSCIGKTYLYRIWNSGEPNVFERNYLYFYPDYLDQDAMCQAAVLLCGEHDFAAFSNAKQTRKSTVRKLDSIEITRSEEELRMYYTGNGFLYNMVRIMTGTLLEVGTGQLQMEEIPKILISGKRENAGFLAPAKGLFLWDVQY